MSSEGRAKTYRDAVLHFQAFGLTQNHQYVNG